MALETEVGEGSSTAESYASVDAADTFLAARGFTLWATGMTTAEKEQSLRRATDYMSQTYRERWAGYRKTSTQALDWPRYEVPRKDTAGFSFYAALYPDDEVPAEAVNACALLAYKAASGDLLEDVQPLAIREKVGPIEVEHAPGSRQTVRYPAIDRLLAPLLKGGASESSVRVVRS